MVDQIKSAVDRLHVAWDKFSSADSARQQRQTQKGALHTHELTRLLDTELKILTSLLPKIKKAEIALRRTRNYSPGVAPINSLPPEVLSRIFYFVPDHPCQVYRTNHAGSWIVYPRSPDYLAQVCSLWRRAAISCSSLWRHIDLNLGDRWYLGLINRAEVYTRRAGRMPIELHVAEDGFYEERNHSCEYLLRFLREVSHRVGTLKIVADPMFGPFHRAVFEGLFFKENSDIKKLVLSSRAEHHNTFIFPTSLDRHEYDWELHHFGLNMSESKFARGFSTINVLHTCGIFPSWSSTAYHGLVDLRLLSTSKPSHIEEAQIKSILESSPALRILHFGLEIHNPTPETEYVTPVLLHDLEVVKLFSESSTPRRVPFISMIRLLAPGQKPLRLSLEEYYEYRLQDTLTTELDRFLARGNVVQIHIQGLIIPLGIILRHSAHLDCVMLSHFNAQSQDEIRASLPDADEPNSLGRLRSLRLRKSYVSQGDLRALLLCCPSGMVLDECHIYCQESEGLKAAKLSEEELSAAFPGVKRAALGLAADPTADWESLN